MAVHDDKGSKVVRAILGVCAAIVLIPVAGMLMLFIGLGLLPMVENLLKQRDFDPQAWAINDDNARYYMTSDVGDFLDENPTRDQVIDKLGVPDFTYICSGECWELGTPTAFSEHFLDVGFDASGRVVRHEVRKH